MYMFVNDYSEGMHQKILDEIVRTNLEQHTGYGMDEYCEKARLAIKKELNNEDSAVHFLVGGTQANTTIICALLRPHQGVISAVSGHINVHESGAIEATGHKVIALPSDDGKITAKQVEDCVKGHFDDPTAEHMVQPKMVYISNPTEVGTIYSRGELEAIKKVCDELNLIFFCDGARLGCALTSKHNDVTLEDMAKLTDVFYIGGTKMGAMFGEAVVINTPKYNEDFRYLIKQKGGMLAKGRLLGVQFLTLFTDGLYYELARHANECAEKLQNAIKEMGYKFLAESPTNQVFPIFPNEIIEKIGEKYGYSQWEKRDGEMVVRFCTSWATDMTKVDELIADLKALTK